MKILSDEDIQAIRNAIKEILKVTVLSSRTDIGRMSDALAEICCRVLPLGDAIKLKNEVGSELITEVLIAAQMADAPDEVLEKLQEECMRFTNEQ